MKEQKVNKNPSVISECRVTRVILVCTLNGDEGGGWVQEMLAIPINIEGVRKALKRKILTTRKFKLSILVLQKFTVHLRIHFLIILQHQPCNLPK